MSAVALFPTEVDFGWAGIPVFPLLEHAYKDSLPAQYVHSGSKSLSLPVLLSLDLGIDASLCYAIKYRHFIIVRH